MQAETERPARESGDQKEWSGFIGECHVAVYTDGNDSSYHTKRLAGCCLKDSFTAGKKRIIVDFKLR